MDFQIDNLPETPDSQITETEIYNAIETYFTSNSKIRVSSRFISTDAEIGKGVLSLEATNAQDASPELQQALDTLHSRGGGTLYLKAGTYTIKTALTGYSGISIIGENQGTTILNFASTAANLSFAGTNLYNTGTLSSIASGLVVTGSGTSWLANVVAGMMIFIGTRWYQIASVDSNTQITLAEFCNDFVSGAYRITTPVFSVRLQEFAVKSSTGSGIKLTDVRNVLIDRVTSQQNNVGFEFDNVSELALTACLGVANTSHGFDLTGTGLVAGNSCLGNNNGGSGWVLNTCDDVALISCTGQNNTADGMNFTSCTDIAVISAANSGNGSQGAECVSGNTGMTFALGNYNDNTSDGIKLTATSDGILINSPVLKDNGGYGINIAASSCDDNTIIVPYFNNNSSGDYNDSGTGTNIVATVQSADIQIFTSDGTWTKPANAKMVYVTMWGGGGAGGRGSGDGGGSGGGGGMYISHTFTATDLGSTETITVGEGGASASSDTNGANGEDSSFGSHMTASGGKGGTGNSANVAKTGGNGGSILSFGQPNYGQGVSQAAGQDGIFSAAGGGVQAGNQGFEGGDSYYGGGGGGGVTWTGTEAAGGTSTLGGDGGAGSRSAAATAGSAPGGGGGGSRAQNSGAGGRGEVRVYTI